MSQRVLKQQNHLKPILIGAAALASLYGLFYYLTNNSSSSKACPLQLTLKMLKQIKYQMCANCISFAQGVNLKLKAKYPQKELQLYLRTEIAKVYDSKQELILGKYQIPKQQYAASLKKHSSNKQLSADTLEIFDMLERAVKGQVPDLTVRPQAKNLYTHKQILRVYYQMCQQIATRVWLQLQDNIKNNPEFNSKNDAHFKKAIKNLSIYQFKSQYLQKKGYLKQWGCPNLTFFKVIESIKLNQPQVKKQASFIQKSYQILIAKISSDPQLYDRRKINHQMQQNFQKLKNPIQATKPQLQLMKKPSATVPIESRNPQAQPQKKKQKTEQDQFDLQKMMMNQLLSRSQEQAQEQKPEVVQPVAQPVVQPIVQQPIIQHPQIVQPLVQPYAQIQKVQQKANEQLQQVPQQSLLISQSQNKQPQQQSLLLSKQPENIQQTPVQQVQQQKVQQVPVVQNPVVSEEQSTNNQEQPRKQQ